MPWHLDLHARNTAPWDAATLFDGTVVVEWTSLAVLDGQSKSDPGGGEGRHTGVNTRALVKAEAEHCDDVKDLAWLEEVLVCEKVREDVVRSTGLRREWRV